MKLINKISLHFLGFVFVLHAFIPHLHHEQLSDKQNQYFHKHIRSIFDVIKLNFHEDVKIVTENQSESNFIKEVFLPHVPVANGVLLNHYSYIPFYGFDKDFLKNFHSLISLFCKSSLILRGPPVVFTL